VENISPQQISVIVVGIFITWKNKMPPMCTRYPLDLRFAANPQKIEFFRSGIWGLAETVEQEFT
jgi:hypothetical protein